MSRLFILNLMYFIISMISVLTNAEDVSLKFPKDLLIGAASSAYQTEGIWNNDGRGESIWDRFIHDFPEKIVDRSNATITSDSYHNYKEDVKLLNNIGFNSYRFSLSWSRLLPNGYNNFVNEKGVEYYHRVLDELEKRKIKPLVTIYHLDHPQNLEDFGGWLNEKMIDAYVEYARFVFKEFGSRVKFFTTFNEPRVTCKLGYEHDIIAPGRKISGGKDICLHNVLKAHAIAYHVYKDEFSHQQGLIGIGELCINYFGRNDSDTSINDIAFDFDCGLIFDPIFSNTGDYPNSVKRVNAYRKRSKFSAKFQLPKFSKKWINYIKGTSDYIGINYYLSATIEFDFGKRSAIDKYLLISQIVNQTWLSTDYLRFQAFPKGFSDLLRRVKKKYNDKPIYILENGTGDIPGLQDNFRTYYLYNYMKELLIAIYRYNCNIKAYMVWSLLDSFEWFHGYSNHFGLVQIDFNSPQRKRTLKNSANWLKIVLKKGKLITPPENFSYSFNTSMIVNLFG